MKINFIINKNYLIVHTLSSTDPSRFSSAKYKKDIVSFQNFAWKKSKSCYNLFVGRLLPDDLADKSIKSLAKELPKFLDVLKKSSEYKKILFQTQKYLDFCKNQWNKNYSLSLKVVKELTGFGLNKRFTVYIAHPSLRNGCYLGKNKIAWGHHEDWSNYATVYIWHEIMHSYFEKTKLDHALIELLCDEELRIRLNGGKYPPFVGHKDLEIIKRKILTHWRKYIKAKIHSINDFKMEVKKKFKLK